MSNILFVFSLLFIGLINSYQTNINNAEIKTDTIEPGISGTYYLEYLKTTNFIFNIIENSDLQMNIHSINCNIEITPKEVIKIYYSYHLYNLKLNSSNKYIDIKPLIDKIEGEFRGNYELKHCPLTINSYYISNNNKQNLKIKNKDDNFFIFDSSLYNNILHISYDIKNISINSFVSLNFILEEGFFN